MFRLDPVTVLDERDWLKARVREAAFLVTADDMDKAYKASQKTSSSKRR